MVPPPLHSGQPARRLEWTPELVARFWDYEAQRDPSLDRYFAEQVGSEVALLIDSLESLEGRDVLDFGCGPGGLVRHLLSRGARVTAADFSTESLKVVQQRFGDQTGLAQLIDLSVEPEKLSAGAFDVVVCLETIEHVLDEQLDGLFQTLYDALKPGGLAFLSTPNEEDLSASSVYCPHCQHEFHRMQHLRSWSKESLRQVLEQKGFEVEICTGLNLEALGPGRSVVRASGARRKLLAVWAGLARCVDLLTRRPFHQSLEYRILTRSRVWPASHLVATARRPAGERSG